MERSLGQVNRIMDADASTEPTSLPAQGAGTAHQLEFIGGQRLLVERGAREDLLTLLAPSGEVVFRVSLTPSGPVLRFESGLRIEASGALEFVGKSLALSGEDGVSIRSGGDASIVATGDLVARAELGDVSLRANDDVRLDGERIRMNC